MTEPPTTGPEPGTVPPIATVVLDTTDPRGLADPAGHPFCAVVG